MNISITTDYCTSLGNVELPLRLIAAAGFTHLHWSHHFNDDFVYFPSEMREIAAVLRRYSLRLLDVHGSYGQEKRWWSLQESERRAGVELVLNRAELFRTLEGEGHLIMHIPCLRDNVSAEENDRQRREFAQVLRSLDELVPELEKSGVELALENMPDDNWELLEQALARYPAKSVGLCYDSGHGNFHATQLEKLARNRSRLKALHLNDNDSERDMHQPPRYGTVDWERLTEIIRTSSYRGPLSFEITMRATPFLVTDRPVLMPPQIQTFSGLPVQPEANQAAFLEEAHRRCLEIASMVYPE